MTITPAIAFENVETGLRLLEKAFQAIGPEGTLGEFYEVLGRTFVPTGTKVREKHDGGFEMVRNAFFAGEGIGRVFIGARVVPAGTARLS